MTFLPATLTHVFSGQCVSKKFFSIGDFNFVPIFSQNFGGDLHLKVLKSTLSLNPIESILKLGEVRRKSGGRPARLVKHLKFVVKSFLIRQICLKKRKQSSDFLGVLFCREYFWIDFFHSFCFLLSLNSVCLQAFFYLLLFCPSLFIFSLSLALYFKNNSISSVQYNRLSHSVPLPENLSQIYLKFGFRVRVFFSLSLCRLTTFEFAFSLYHPSVCRL